MSRFDSRNSAPPPFMELHEVEAITALLRSYHTPLQALEWGSGASTIYFGSRLPYGSIWQSVEHDREWYEQTLREADRWNPSIIQIKHIPPDRPWKDTSDDGSYEIFRRYVLHPATLGRTFDIILVDGRARVQCMATGWELLKQDGVMILHDAERPEYIPGIPENCHYLRLSAFSSRTGGQVSTLFMAKQPYRLARVERKLRRFLPESISFSSNISGSEPGRRILFANISYPAFLEELYRSDPELEAQPYYRQKRAIMETCFGDSDFYSSGMEAAGWDAEDVVMNCAQLQTRWVLESNASAATRDDVLFAQVRQYRPDILYMQDLSPLSREFIETVRPYVKLVVAQIASPIPSGIHLEGIDIIFTSFPHFVERFRRLGIAAYYQPLAFKPEVLMRLPREERNIPVSFVGGISPFHGNGLTMLEELSRRLPFDIWGYGAVTLPDDSPLRQNHHGEAWGLQMFSLLAASRITINRHIDVAEENANNMRLFEATGCGALLLTDYKDNLEDLFKIGEEVVAYRTPEEAALLARYYSRHPERAAEIAAAGQQRTLRDHTYDKRMTHTAEILERHLRYLDEAGKFPEPDYANISCNYQHISKEDIAPELRLAWQDAAIPSRQRALVQSELAGMYHGSTPLPYRVLADLLQHVVKRDMKILEIGCASGYYSEVIEYLLSKQIDYTGVDYSEAMIAMARDYYPGRTFEVADGSSLPFANRSFPLVISGCVLLHTPDYLNHIAETARIADLWIVLHRTPVTRIRPTEYVSKNAYGIETVELHFNEQELLSAFERHGFIIRHSLTYAAHPDNDLYETSYLLGRIE